MKRKTLAWTGIALLALLAIVVVNGGHKGNQADSTYVRIPLSELSTTAKFYTYGNARYFAVLGSDGQPRTAFDACQTCGPKGYTQNGNNMKCKNCGREFSIDSLGVENTGYGCWPGYLPSEVAGGEILIKKSDLAGSKFFKQ